VTVHEQAETTTELAELAAAYRNCHAVLVHVQAYLNGEVSEDAAGIVAERIDSALERVERAEEA